MYETSYEMDIRQRWDEIQEMGQFWNRGIIIENVKSGYGKTIYNIVKYYVQHVVQIFCY